MAILNKIIPAPENMDGGTAAMELQLTYDSHEIPWDQADIYFYNINGTAIEGSTLANQTVNNGKINSNIAIGNSSPLSLNQHYLVSVGKTDTDIKTNSRVMLIMQPPEISDLVIEQENKKICFTYSPNCDTEILDKYQFLITDTTDSSACEISNIIKNTVESGVVINYYYSLYLKPEHLYEFKLITYSKSGLIVEKISTLTIPASPSYTDNAALIPIKPIVVNNEEYGYVKIAMPREIIKYCSSVSKAANGTYTLNIPNCYGCDNNNTAQTVIYSSLSLTNFIKAASATEYSVQASNVNRWVVQLKTNGTFVPTETCCVGFAPKGKFKLLKENRIGEFEALTTIVLPADQEYVYEDYMVEQGYEYKYYLVPDDTGLTSGAIAANIRPQWDSIILSDAAGKTLSIQYNPQVSSFKTTILEQKQDTLGNKYPFFLRSGDTYYKEIPLSGLISYQADKLNKFQAIGMPGLDTLTRKRTRDYTELSNYDEFYLERMYKRQVEEWLNNGEPKLLRTAAEGTFIVRLTNVSLSPMQQLGRRLHTFSATAYEIADYNFTNLQAYGFNILNTAPSTSEGTDTLTGTVIQESQVLTINNIPYGKGEEFYKIIINNKLDIKPNKIRFKNTASSGTEIRFMTNMSTANTINVRANHYEEKDIIGDNIWFYVLGDSSTNAQVQLVYQSAKL